MATCACGCFMNGCVSCRECGRYFAYVCTYSTYNINCIGRHCCDCSGDKADRMWYPCCKGVLCACGCQGLADEACGICGMDFAERCLYFDSNFDRSCYQCQSLLTVYEKQEYVSSVDETAFADCCRSTYVKDLVPVLRLFIINSSIS